MQETQTFGGKPIEMAGGLIATVTEFPPTALPCPRPWYHGLRRMTNAELQRIAKMNSPPPVYFYGEEEKPF